MRCSGDGRLQRVVLARLLMHKLCHSNPKCFEAISAGVDVETSHEHMQAFKHLTLVLSNTCLAFWLRFLHPLGFRAGHGEPGRIGVEALSPASPQGLNKEAAETCCVCVGVRALPPPLGLDVPARGGLATKCF